MAKPNRGLESHQELPASHNRVDFRRPVDRFRHFMVEKSGGPVVLMLFLGIMLVFPTLMETTFLVGMGLMFWMSKQKFHLPLRMPKTSGLKDHNDPSLNPKDKGGPGNAAGIVFVGNEMGTNKELWVNASDAGTHFLIFGTTGAGKAILDSEPVHTPTGWVRADQLQENDLVSTADGRAAPIVGIYEQGERSLLRVHLEDGRAVEVSEDHLWAVQPYQRTGPLVAEPGAADEVISTRDLHDRLLRHEALALPLPLAVEGPDADWGSQLPQRVVQALHALQGEGAFPEAPESGSARQRHEFWAALRDAAQSLHLCRSVGRAHHFEAVPPQVATALLALVRSLGRWASYQAEDGQLMIVEGATQVRVVRVEDPKRSAPCRCIKLDDPRGLFLIRDYIVTHNTETLISIAYNALVHGSGFIYVDGKGDNSLFMKLFSMTRAAGRHDDLLCINYMTGGRDVVGPQEDKLSNNLNPFISGTAGSLTQLLVSLMPSQGGGGSDGMWQGRAVSFIGSLMMALVHLRNEGLMELGVAQIREHLTLEKIEELAKRTDLTPRILTSLEAYLRGLPGYVPNPPDGKQGEIPLEQHGFLQMQFSRIMSSLADDYGYIFNTTRGEVDFFDVVLNNRILTVLLPSLEKSPEELGNLGKIIVASLKSMMATGLGDRVEGEVAVIVDSKATNAPSPFLCILDEYGYYVVTGAAVMPAQARSLNFSMVFAGQDYSSFKKNNNKEEAEATVANCNLIAFMKTVDTADTADLFMKSVGKARVAIDTGYQRNTGALGGSGYLSAGNAQVQQEERGDLQDLRDQGPGEAHIIFKSTLVRTKMFYAEPPRAKKIRLNHFLRVEPATPEQIEQLETDLAKFRDLLSHPDRLDARMQQHALPPALRLNSTLVERAMGDHADAVKASLMGLMAIQKTAIAGVEKFKTELNNLQSEPDSPSGDVLHIFLEADDLPMNPEDAAFAQGMAGFPGNYTTPPNPHAGAGGYTPPAHTGAAQGKGGYGSGAYGAGNYGDSTAVADDYFNQSIQEPHRAGRKPTDPSVVDRYAKGRKEAIKPTLPEETTREHLQRLEKAGGADDLEAYNRSEATVSSLKAGTEYPKPQAKPHAIQSAEFEDILSNLYEAMDTNDPASSSLPVGYDPESLD